MGKLSCNYYDFSSCFMSLDTFSGFAGQLLSLDKSYIKNMNKNTLHLDSICLKLEKTNIDYEHLFLTTSAPNLRKIEICGKKFLNDKDLLFISGFYNLESVHIKAIISSYEQLDKLEKLRELYYILCSNEKQLEETKQKRARIYAELKDTMPEEKLKRYLMAQRMLIQRNLQEFRNRLYVPRLDRVKWEEKIATKDLKSIKQELIAISKMNLEEKINISREKREYTFMDHIHGLDFGFSLYDKDDGVFLVNSDPNPFTADGINYYVERKKLKLVKDIEKSLITYK